MGKTHIDYVIENLAKRIILEELQNIWIEIKNYQADAFYPDDVTIRKREVLEIIDTHIKEITNEECD